MVVASIIIYQRMFNKRFEHFSIEFGNGDGRKRNRNPDTCGRVKFCNRYKMSADTNESVYV